ncbi:CBS domain-containing protein [Candidatus Pacearchaeota archaeon]|jgi:CBS domain-containing protein|nr:CBS domain-containing protein [Candidatus Pacearchaeota archaeon]
MKKVLVADVMTRDPVTISPDANLLDCAKKMVKKKVGSLIIVENKKLLGFISQSDILWALTKKASGNLKNVKAIEISPKKVVVIKPEITLNDTIEKMKKTKFERLPVVQDNKLVGIITAKDILNFNPEFYPEIEEFSKIKQESEKLRRIKEAEKRREGICEECGNQGILFKANGMLVCESCKDSI